MIQLIEWTVFQGSDGKKGYGEINIYCDPAVEVFFQKRWEDVVYIYPIDHTMERRGIIQIIGIFV